MQIQPVSAIVAQGHEFAKLLQFLDIKGATRKILTLIYNLKFNVNIAIGITAQFKHFYKQNKTFLQTKMCSLHKTLCKLHFTLTRVYGLCEM